MSHTYFNELWLIARNDLEKLLKLDRSLQNEARPPTRDIGLSLILPTYLKYRDLVKRLIVCHDQMVQSQKRDLIKRVLDCAVGRMLEYKREIVNWNCSDYAWPDDFMNQLKFTPDDVDIFVSATGKDVVQQRRKQIEEMIEKAQKQPVPEEQSTIDESEDASETQEASPRMRKRRVKEVSEEPSVPAILYEPPEVVAAREARLAAEERLRNAVLLIQSHERARMGRCVGTEVERIYKFSMRVQAGMIVPKKTTRSTYEKAAKVIQRAWRRYAARKRMKKRINRVEELLGMTIPSWKDEGVFLKDKENFQKRLEMIPTFAAQTVKAAEEERARLWKIRGPGLMEDITDEIREWFILWYNEAGHFDAYPAASVGGSVLIVTDQTLTPQEYLIQKMTKDADKEGDKRKKGKKDRKKKKGRPPLMPETKAFTCLEEGNQNFITDWSFYDDRNDPPHKIYRHIIKDKLCYELQLEMREVVDELMRLELKQLNAALKKDYAADNQELDIPKQKGGKKKKGKKKKKKDPLGKISLEKLFKELVDANIIRNYPLTSIKDWIGDLSYQNYEAEFELREFSHRLGEIKQVIMEYCVLPLSSKEIHKIAPLIRSVCICGLARCGKSFLVNAICSEVGALMFDMTPSILAGQYTGRKNEKKLINMISKVARELAPSVIFIDNGEKPWVKTVPVEERHLQPKRFAKHYPKLVKSIKPGDQILFLTTSSEPYKATSPFIRIHDKFIMIPLTDYNTLYMFYKDLLMKYHGVDRNIDISSMAKMSVGIPLEFIKKSIENVLNLRRRIQLQFNPLNPKEVLDEVLKYEEPKAKVLNDFVKFENRMPLNKRRVRLLAFEKEERERLEKMEQQAQ
ncbi:IQ and AAA domain-containing protein 1-like [Calliopsis andreniformis]|uniref:IQ and AAA domain-containing protein 1-like n=1 Tax=Calliopsis andreniformis TaxID=337506 RepID=UPI003FCC4547